MISLRRGLLNTTGLLLIGLAVFYAQRFWPQPGVPKPAIQTPSAAEAALADYVITDFHAIDLDESGRLRYELTAARLEHFPVPARAELTEPEMVFYRHRHEAGEEAVAPWQLTALQGTVSPDGERVDLAGEVRVTRLSGAEGDSRLTLETSRLTVLGDQEVATTAEPVVIRTMLASLSGTGMKVDLRHGRMTLLANVRGQYDPP